jgi:peptidoglycan/xylan/chitin deacetylase (PgdA/CDA1 family)
MLALARVRRRRDNLAVLAFRDRPLVLAYHAVSSTWDSPLAVTEEALSRHASYLHGRGYAGLTLAEVERRRASGTLPSRVVVFTFDDGYRSTARAAEILDRYGYPGTVFTVTAFADSGAVLSWAGIEHEWTPENTADLAPLGWDELAALRDRGWEVGSHTVTHTLLTGVDDSRLASELAESRRTIADRLGRCETVAYPYGIADARVAAAARRAGYAAACTLTGAHVADEQYLRPRVGMGSSDTGARLRAKVSPLGVELRRSAAARTVRRLRRTRDWLPADGTG